MTGGRHSAIEGAQRFFDSGQFFDTLERRIGYQTESQSPEQASVVRAYLTDEVAPALAHLGFTSRIVFNPEQPLAPFLIASRIEDPSFPTVLTYGHGDVVNGYDQQWRDGLSPWRLKVAGDFW